jgi:hypothetical protein
VISSIPVAQVNMWYPFQISDPAIVAISNRYPIKRETPPLSVRNGASYTIITHPFV